MKDNISEVKNKKKMVYEQNIKDLNKELEIQNKKLSNVYDFFEEGTYTREMFSERCNIISATIKDIKNNIDEFEHQIELESAKEEGRKSIIPKIENVIVDGASPEELKQTGMGEYYTDHGGRFGGYLKRI